MAKKQIKTIFNDTCAEHDARVLCRMRTGGG